MREFLIRNENSLKFQLIVYILISITVLILTGLFLLTGANNFSKYFGQYPPLLIIAIFSFLGAGASIWLWNRYHCFITKSTPPFIQWLPVVLTLCCSFAAIIIDVNIVFDEDINVAFPYSLLFYPAIGFFHWFWSVGKLHKNGKNSLNICFSMLTKFCGNVTQVLIFHE